MQECKGTNIPITKGFQINSNEQIENNIPYRELVGNLMFISTVSRPDITYATSYLSRFLDKPNRSAWKEGKRILRYLKETIDYGLRYYKSEKQEIETYSDADWATNHIDRRSTSGSVTFYCDNAISWFSRKQGCVALSTAEAEYIAAATSVSELINIQGLCNDLKVSVKSVLYMDNKSAIDISHSFENSKRTKHIDIRFHFIKDFVLNGKAKVQYVDSKNNIADIFTKSLSFESFSFLRTKLNVT